MSFRWRTLRSALVGCDAFQAVESARQFLTWITPESQRLHGRSTDRLKVRMVRRLSSTCKLPEIIQHRRCLTSVVMYKVCSICLWSIHKSLMRPLDGCASCPTRLSARRADHALPSSHRVPVMHERYVSDLSQHTRGAPLMFLHRRKLCPGIDARRHIKAAYNEPNVAQSFLTLLSTQLFYSL